MFTVIVSATTCVVDQFAFALDIYISSCNKATVHPAILPQVLVHPGEETERTSEDSPQCWSVAPFSFVYPGIWMKLGLGGGRWVWFGFGLGFVAFFLSRTVAAISGVLLGASASCVPVRFKGIA